MKWVITDHIVLSRPPEGPLSAHVGPFAEYLSAQCYALKSIHRQVHLAACFSQWLQPQGVALPHLTADHAKQYLQYRALRVKPRPGDAAALQHVSGFLRRAGVVPSERRYRSVDSRQRSAGRKSTSTICARYAAWQKRPLSTTCRSSTSFLKIGSQMDRSHSHACAPSMS
jgi:hypothetical protein